MHLPGHVHGVRSYATSHQDLAPTFMEMLGATSPPEDYSDGRSLFDADGTRRIVACGWSECAWIHDDGYVVFGTSGGNSLALEVRDRDYLLVEEGGTAANADPAALAGLATDLGRFLAD